MLATARPSCFVIVYSLKTLILIVVYLNMCNSLTITFVFFLAAHFRFHALCFISCILYFSCIILSILLNCVKVCDCHTFNKRLLILFTYLVSFLHSYYINCIFGSFSLSSPLCVAQMLKYDTATQKYVTKPSVDCVCRIWRRQFGSKQKMGGSLLRQ